MGLGGHKLAELELTQVCKGPFVSCDFTATLTSVLGASREGKLSSVSISMPIISFIVLKEKPGYLRFIDLPIVIQ